MTTPYRKALDELKAAENADIIARNTNKTYRASDYQPRINAAQGIVDMLTIDLTDVSPPDALEQVLPFLEGATCANDLRDTGHIYKSGKYSGGLLFWIADILGGLHGHNADTVCDDLSAAVKCLPDDVRKYDMSLEHDVSICCLWATNRSNHQAGDRTLPLRPYRGVARTTPLAIVIAALKYGVLGP